MGRWIRRWADTVTRGENERLRAETRNLRRIVRELNDAYKAVEYVAERRITRIGRLEYALAEAQQQGEKQ